MLIETPLLDEIAINKWFNTKYNNGQKTEIQSLIKNHLWITAKKVKIFVKEMTTSHIKNCINCWEGKGKTKIPADYLGGKDKWIDIFSKELLNRQ